MLTVSENATFRKVPLVLLRLTWCAVPLALLLQLSPQALAGVGAGTVVVLHTNDMHAAFIPHEAMWVRQEPRPLVGGFVELQATIDSVRAAAPASLLLDAGDVMTGNPITDLAYKGGLGGALFEMMNMIGYDAWSIGNHDLDISQDNLRALTSIARFPTLSANLVDDAGGFPLNNRPYAVFERGGLRIGVIGLMTQGLSSLVNQYNLVGLRVLSPEETLQRLINELDPATDLLIALTHQGWEEDSLLAASVTGLDVIVGGHSHTRLREPRKVNDILIVQAGSNAENLGVLRLTVRDDRVDSYEGRLLSLWSRPGRPATPLSGMVDSLQADLEKVYSEVIGTVSADWKRQNGPSAIGSFITEAQRVAAAADIAFMNIHGIRRDVPAGPVTKKTLFEVMPFRNVLVTFQLTGLQVRQALAHHIRTDSKIQVTGLSATYRKEADGTVRIVSANVQGRALEDDRAYVCAASDFFVGQADKYLGLTVPQPVYLRETLFQVVERAVRKAGVITPSMPYTLTQVP